jgi:excisionase family DNA binding protein
MHPSSPQKVTPEWLRYPEAERYSGLGRSTLTKLVSFGEIKAAKVGKSVRINRASLEEYMRQQIAGGEKN